MSHPDRRLQDNRAIQRGLNLLFAMFACLSGSAVLTRERDWRYMLIMVSPYLALFVCLLCLAALARLKRRKERERSWLLLSTAVMATAQEKFQLGRSSEALQVDKSGVQMTIPTELTQNRIDPLVPYESMESDSSYGLILAGLSWLWLLTALPFITDAACNFIAAIVLALTWFALALTWLCGLFVPYLLRSSSARLWWSSAGLAGLLGLVLAFSDVGLILRVALSERALNTYVASISPGTQNPIHPNHQVGLFFVDGTEESNGVVALYTSSDFLDRQGIIFVPDAATPPGHFQSLRHLYGKWYSFWFHF